MSVAEHPFLVPKPCKAWERQAATQPALLLPIGVSLALRLRQRSIHRSPSRNSAHSQQPVASGRLLAAVPHPTEPVDPLTAPGDFALRSLPAYGFLARPANFVPGLQLSLSSFPCVLHSLLFSRQLSGHRSHCLSGTRSGHLCLRDGPRDCPLSPPGMPFQVHTTSHS